MILDDDDDLIGVSKSRKGSSKSYKNKKYSKNGSKSGSVFGTNQRNKMNMSGGGSMYNSNHSAHQFNSLNFSHPNMPPHGGLPPMNFMHFSNPGMGNQNRRVKPLYQVPPSMNHHGGMLNSQNFDIEDIIKKEQMNQSNKPTADSDQPQCLPQQKGMYGNMFNSNLSGFGSNNSG